MFILKLLLIACSLVGFVGALFGPPKNCNKNVHYWASKKMNFFEFDHLQHFADCLHNITIEGSHDDDPVIETYKQIEPEVSELASHVLKQRSFCSGKHMQAVVDHGERYMRPLEGDMNWDMSGESLESFVEHKPALSLPELKTNEEHDHSSENDDSTNPIDHVDAEVEKIAPSNHVPTSKGDEHTNEDTNDDIHNSPVEPVTILSTTDRRELLKPFRRIYYGYVGQVAKECWKMFEFRTKYTLSDKQFYAQQEELCQLLEIFYDASGSSPLKLSNLFGSSYSSCHKLLQAKQLQSVLASPLDNSNQEIDTSRENMNNYVSMIDRYLKRNLPEPAASLLAEEDEQQSKTGDSRPCKLFTNAEREQIVDGHRLAMNKLHEACASLKGAYDLIMAPVTVLAGAGYVIDSLKLYRAQLRKPRLAKWLQIQRVCDTLLRTKVVPVDAPTTNELHDIDQVNNHQLSDDVTQQKLTHYRIELDLNQEIKFETTVIMNEVIPYVRCRGSRNQFCGFIYVHPKRTAFIVLVAGITLLAVAGGALTGVTLLVGGAAAAIAGAVQGFGATVVATKCMLIVGNHLIVSYMAGLNLALPFGRR